MSGENEATTAQNPDESEISASTRRLASLARGYTFQDVVAGACILSVFFEESGAVSIERKHVEGDKFDDINLERNGEVICMQVKNGPEHSLSDSDLTGSSSRGLDLDELSESAENRLESDEGSRFIILTSFEREPGSGVEFSDDADFVSLLGDFEFPAMKLVDGQGEISDGAEIEFVLGVPGIGTTTDEEEIESPRKTELFEEIVERVAPRLDVLENPEIDDPYSLTERVVSLARWARNQPVDVRRLNRAEIVRRLELTPSPRFLQRLSIPEGYIRPVWIDELEEAYDNSNDRVLVEGKPGSGKSVGIELIHRSREDSEDRRTLRFYLYNLEDADSLEVKRSDPAWFRHQLAAQIYDTFPEAFGESSSVPVWTGTEDLQQYINNVAEWAEQEDQRILFIIDGLDHALREFGGTTATESAEGTVLEEIGALDFPAPLGLLMVSREITEAHETLRVDTQIDVPPWNSEEIREYLERNDVSPDEDLVGQMEDVSGGLPVILSHLLRKAETHEAELQTGLRSAVAEASHVDGQLQEYYETIWEPLHPYEQDAVTLVALNPTGLQEETVEAVIDLPYTQEETRLEESPLSHILDSLPDGRFRVFHDSFRTFTEDQLDPEEIERGHERLFQYLLNQCTIFPEHLESLKYHAENGPGRNALKDLATLNNVLDWWEEGVHLDLISDSLELAFDASLRDCDYLTAVDCVILGGVSRNMLDIYLHDNLRLTYFISQGDRDRALRLVNQIREYEGGKEEALEAMQLVAQNWEGELDREWLAKWEEDFQDADQPSWNPDAYFEIAGAVLEPDLFWELAGDIRREDSGEHFPREVLKVVRKKPELLDSQPDPPDWLFENPSLALEACEDLIHVLPDSWRDELRENAPTYSSLSLAALHTLLRCGGSEDEIQQIAEKRELGESEDEPGPGGVRFYDVYYVGSILASVGTSPEELLAKVEEIAVEQVRIQKLLAIMGAAVTRNSSAETERWVDATLEFIEEILDEGRLAFSEIRHLDYFRYNSAITQVVDTFSEVVDQGSEDVVRCVLELAENTDSDDRFLDKVCRTLDETRGQVFPEDTLPEGLDRRYEEVTKRPPKQEPPTEELMDLAIRAIESGYNERGEKYVEAAAERCFRYGYHKDMFLRDVWNGIEDIAENGWDRHLGTAIQLINWANLLHELTDGDETHNFEGEFLKTLLNAGVVDYHTAEERARNNTTMRKLWDWRLRNSGGMTYEELDSLIYAKETKIRSSQYSNRKLPFFSKAAQVAKDFGWDDLVDKALYALNRGEYVRDGISSEDEERLRDLASEHDVEIPAGLQPDSSSTDYGDKDEESVSEDEPVRFLLSQHSEDDPLTPVDFKSLSTEELLTAGDLIQRKTFDSTRYDPTAAAPVSRVLADRSEEEQAVLLLENVIAERDLMHWWLGGGQSRFVALAEALVDISDEDALQTVLSAWRKSRLDTMGYQGTFPQLVWIVKRTEGQTAAEELFSHTMNWMRRLVWPYEDRVQKWGVLEPTY